MTTRERQQIEVAKLEAELNALKVDAAKVCAVRICLDGCCCCCCCANFLFKNEEERSQSETHLFTRFTHSYCSSSSFIIIIVKTARKPVADTGEDARARKIVPFLGRFRGDASTVRGDFGGVETGERLGRHLRTRRVAVETTSAAETSDWGGRERGDVVH